MNHEIQTMTIQTYQFPPRDTWPSLLRRPVMNLSEIEPRVQPVLEAIEKLGDAAVRDFTQRFDQVDLDELAVPAAAFDAAEAALDESLKAAIQVAKTNIERFHARQKEPIERVETMPGVVCWRKSVPIQRVGLYIPGGSAPLFSTLLMLGVPAKLAGCQEIVLCTPPGPQGTPHPAILYTARLVGIDRVFRVGGAQAIAAMGYGTESIPAVDKLFGPGNQYVTMAKQLMAKRGLPIDMPAGPSEVAVVADESANPAFVASDLLSQAEHGIDSQVILVSTSAQLIQQVETELSRQLQTLPRRDIAVQAIAQSRAILLKDQDEVVDLINQYAAEHLILATTDAEALGERIVNAGSVFLGHYSPESVGDYASGTNHTLPTNGWARSYSGVSLDSFVKKITFQQLTQEGLQQVGPAVMAMAEAESLEAHRRAVEVRLERRD
jgi:histidinol dehydrogenase